MHFFEAKQLFLTIRNYGYFVSFRFLFNRLDFIQAFLFIIEESKEIDSLEERYANSIYMIAVLFEYVFFLS